MGHIPVPIRALHAVTYETIITISNSEVKSSTDHWTIAALLCMTILYNELMSLMDETQSGQASSADLRANCVSGACQIKARFLILTHHSRC
jgi:hypothetical protein